MDELQHQGFVIDSDSKADWALRKIKESESERDMWLDFYKTQAKRITEKYENDTSYLVSLLNQYFQTVPHKATKTQESYKLPSGKLQLSYAKESLTQTDELLSFLKESNLQEYIRIKEEPAWNEFKKTLNAVDGRVVTNDGLVVTGVVIKKEPATFKAVIKE